MRTQYVHHHSLLGVAASRLSLVHVLKSCTSVADPGGWARGISYPASKFLKPYRCNTSLPWHAAPSRWCGLEGQIKDMKVLGANPATGQLTPGVWMDACYPNGSMTQQGWTQKTLRQFLAYASKEGVRVIAIWAMNFPCGSLCYPESSYTCPWFLPELRRFVLDD